jgi:hypothetical protein
MNARTQITMDPELTRRAQAKASSRGISFAEYVRRLVADDLREKESKPDISIVFDLVDEGPQTNIARDKDKMIAAAVWKNYLRKTAGNRRSATGARKARR